MPDLRPDGGLHEAYLPPALRPGGGAYRPADPPARRDAGRVPLTRAEMLAAARSLLDTLLGGLVDDPEACDEAVAALLDLGRRDGRRPDRRRLDPVRDDLSGPVAATQLGLAVRGIVEAAVQAPVSDETVAQATMGVEFAAQVEEVEA